MLKPSEPGVRRCMSCGWLFVSPDVLKIARCADCKRDESAYSPRATCVGQVHGVARQYLTSRDTS